jgi:hypothetical protein
MHNIKRLETFEYDDFDKIMLLIKNGTIKCGKYSHLVKIKKDYKINRKELFTDGKDDKG